ncbi:unnamed protein product [Paramecium octaurelia]|uniref:Protein kinase domain-containing protein n=1 Tax=Paramecium octaurelia TaxID=43137 RepID=A0A8S1X2P4_PAROT|nr:unnamed protein product [Paramecium octaurelia]
MAEDIDQKLLQRFEIIQKIRKVSGGVIWKAIDRKTNIAIKKIDYSANPLHLLKSMRETVILQEISKHPNIMKVLQVINKGNDQYTIYDFVDMDLISLIKVKILQPKHIQIILCNIVTALYFIHSGGLVHLSLTPSKILVDSECQIKLIGFGFSQLLPIKDPKYTCLHYLPPEILLQGKVNTSADIWSLGCIFGEMLCHHPLFVGNSTFNQIEKIVELIGKPNDTNLSELAPYVLQGIQPDRKKAFTSISDDSTAVDLLKRMLVFEPQERITLIDILKHPYLSEFANKCELKKAIAPFQIEENSFKEFQNVLRERGKKVEQPSINNSFNQQLDTSRKKSFRESTPISALKQKTSTKIKVNSPIQSPKIQKLYQIDEKQR